MRTSPFKCAAGLLSALSLAVWATPSAAQPIVYPAKGQSAEQQEKDKFECYSWAKKETGIDPMAPAQAGSQDGGAVRGAARGAAVGAVGGAIGGDAGKGAAIGAGVGGAGGAIRRRSSEKQAQQANSQNRATYDRAYSACMGGRGYTVQ